MRRSFPAVACLVLFVFTTLPLGQVDAASIQAVGGLWPHPALSDDGSVVVGVRRPENTTDLFRWAEEGGMVDLGSLSEYGYPCPSVALSGNGSVIVGADAHQRFRGGFVWSESTGIVYMDEYFPNTTLVSYDVTYDGNIIVGTEYDYIDFTPSQGFKAEFGGSLTYLSGLNGASSSEALVVTPDGSVVAGVIHQDTGPSIPWEGARWTTETGWIGLGSPYTYPEAVSSDGSVIVGCDRSSSEYQAFRWTAETGVVGLGFLEDDDDDSKAVGITADGSTIVGSSSSGAFIWTADGGMRSLQDELVDVYGLDMAGWGLRSAVGISTDGTRILGYGFSPSHISGESSYCLIAIPEPGSAVMLAVGVSCLLRRDW